MPEGADSQRLSAIYDDVELEIKRLSMTIPLLAMVPAVAVGSLCFEWKSSYLHLSFHPSGY